MRFTMDTVRQPGHPPVRSAAGLEGGRFQLVLSIPLLWHWHWHWHDEVDHNHHMRATMHIVPCTMHHGPCTEGGPQFCRWCRGAALRHGYVAHSPKSDGHKRRDEGGVDGRLCPVHGLSACIGRLMDYCGDGWIDCAGRRAHSHSHSYSHSVWAPCSMGMAMGSE